MLILPNLLDEPTVFLFSLFDVTQQSEDPNQKKMSHLQLTVKLHNSPELPPPYPDFIT